MLAQAQILRRDLMAEFDLRRATTLLEYCKYSELFQYCTEGAQTANANAMEFLSRCYLYGYGVADNEAMAVRWCSLAAELGNRAAEAAMQDFTPAQIISAYYTLANNGDTYSALCLALQYKSGEFINRNNTEAKLLFEQAAIDHPRALYELGLCYENGDGTDRDAEKAIEYFLEAADAGYMPAKTKLSELEDLTDRIINSKIEADLCIPDAQYTLGKSYEYGLWVEKDESYAFVLYTAAAQQGHSDAKFRLGYMFENGHGTTVKLKKAFEMYKEAAEGGNNRAALCVAYFLENGIGTKKNIPMAISAYEAANKGSIAAYYLAGAYVSGRSGDAAAQAAYEMLSEDSIVSTDDEIREYLFDARRGDARAQFHLGFLYECKHDNENLINAYEMYSGAAEQGNVPAMHRLGRCYEFGLGVATDEDEARSWYAVAAQQGHVPSMYRLAMLLSTDNKEQSVELYSMAAEVGHSPSLCILALHYDLGDIVEKSHSKACTLIEKAKKTGATIMTADIKNCNSMAGEAQTEYLRGIMYEAKYGDSPEAAGCYEKSANMGFSPAIFRLAECYLNGAGGFKRNMKTAFELYARAAEAGHAEALCRLGECYENGYGVKRDDNAAFECYTSAANADSASAQYSLGRFYATGICCLQDRGEAFDWYRRASKNGNEPARIRIEEHARSLKMIGLDILSAKKGDAVAEYKLGQAYETGTDIDKNETEAYKWYLQSATHGYAQAQYKMAQYMDKTYDSTYSKSKAVYWYKRAAKQGHPDAILKLQEKKSEQSAYYIYSKVMKDPQNIYQVSSHLQPIQRLAARGVAWAQYLYGKYCELETSKKYSQAEAVEWYKKASAKGHKESLYEMGEHYFNADGIACDYDKAIDYYRRAAAKKHPQSCLMLGLCYERCYGTDYNPEMAFHHYKEAHNLKCAEGTYRLACCYENGRGVRPDKSEAYRLFALAAECGNPNAKYRLSQLILNKCIESDIRFNPIQLCIEAANDGYAYALITYGQWLIQGERVPQNKRFGFTCIYNAAQQGNSMAAYLAGMCYKDGIGVSKNQDKATRMLLRAAQIGNSNAQYEYTVCAPQDTTHANTLQRWRYTAAINGETRAIEYYMQELGAERTEHMLWSLATIKRYETDENGNHSIGYELFKEGLRYEYGYGVEKDIQTAIELYTRAIDADCVVAIHRLSVIYRTGDKVSYDGEKADILLRRAARKEYRKAKHIVTTLLKPPLKL